MRPAALFWGNPVIIKDVRTRMRGKRAFLLVTAHLIILTIAISIVYLIFQSSLTANSNLQERRLFGKAVFGLLIWMELVMISFVAPALTSSAISAECERQTFDLLKVTLIPSRNIILGKYLSGLGFLFLLLFTSIPLQGPAFLIGGVIWQEILLATVILLTTAIAFCALALLLSTIIRRTLISTTLSYAVTIFLVFGIPLIAGIFLVLLNAGLSNTFSHLSFAGEHFLILAGWMLVSLTPIGVIIGTEVILLDQNSLFIADIPIRNITHLYLPSPWITYVIFYVLFSLAALWLSIQLIKQPEN